MRVRSTFFALAIGCAAGGATGCLWDAPTPRARVHQGPAYPRATRPSGAGFKVVAASPATCKGADPAFDCPPALVDAVAASTRVQLEFAGYHVVDSELLHEKARRRSTRTITSESSPPPFPPLPRAPTNGFDPPADPDRETVRTEGRRWGDLAAGEQHRLLVECGADARLDAEVVVGAAHGGAHQQTVAVQITLKTLDGTLAWESECRVESGDFHTHAQAFDLATRCAMDSARAF